MMSEKHEKSRFVGIRPTRKQRKTAFLHGGKQEFSENQLSLMRENKKLAKNGFPSRGKTRKQRKTDFPREGKPKISGRYFPNIGKTEKRRKNAFPNLGRTKNGRKWLSQHWEDRKTAKKCFPKLGKNKKSQRLYFPTLGRTKNIVGSFSNPLDERFFLFFIHPRSRKGCFFHFSFIRGLGRAFQCVAFHQSVCCLVQ